MLKFSYRNYEILIFFRYFRDQMKFLGMKVFAYFTWNYLSVTRKASISLINKALYLLHINLMRISKDRCEDLIISKIMNISWKNFSNKLSYYL